MSRKAILIIAACLMLAGSAAAQEGGKAETAGKEVGPIRSSAAYAEVLLRKTELQSDLESFLIDYTEQNPKVVDVRFELAALNKEIDKIFAVRPSETAKLTSALGKLVLKKVELETDLSRLLRSYSADHPEVKRMKRKVELYAAAVKEILG
ncbi:MAG: hypothetical protein K1X36_02095 [Pyrinomonadaceae bacterium]|nr:hypothetical protein [Pyrinomonadaceae bacterium]